MKRHHRIVFAGLVLALSLGVAHAQVMKLVPGDSMVVVKVNKLRATSTKIAELAEQWGVAAMNPVLADPLGSLMQEIELEQGVNDEGDLAIAFMGEAEGAAAKPAPAARAGRRADQNVLILVPVSDYKAFLGNFPGAQTQGAITQISVPRTNKKNFVAQWGTHAAISPMKELVSKKAEGLKVEGFAAKEMDTKDVVVYVNMPAARKKLLPKFQAQREQIVQTLEAQMNARGAVNERFMPLAKVAVNQMLNGVERFLEDTRAVTYGAKIEKEGLGVTVAADFLPASYLGKITSQVKNTDQPLLTGLPQAQYLVYGGASLKSESLRTLVNDALEPVITELKALGDEIKPVSDYLDAVRAYQSALEQQSFGMAAPTGALGQESLLQVVNVSIGDAKAINAAQKEMFMSQQSLMELFGGPEATQMKTVYTPKAKTLDGVVFDQFQTQFNLNPQTPQEAQAAQMMALMYGPQGLSGYSGAVNDKHHITTSGVGDALLKQVIAQVKAGGSPLAKSETLSAVTPHLPSQRVAAMYVPVDQIVTTALTYARQFGMPVQLELPPNLPPIGMTLAAEGSTARVDTYIPSVLVQNLVAAGMQMMMQMQGDPGAPPGGL